MVIASHRPQEFSGFGIVDLNVHLISFGFSSVLALEPFDLVFTGMSSCFISIQILCDDKYPIWIRP